MRRMIAPGVWSENIPAVLHRPHITMTGASQIGDMSPLMEYRASERLSVKHPKRTPAEQRRDYNAKWRLHG